MRSQRRIRAYQPSELVAGHSVELDQRTRHHFVSVLRLKKDDAVILFNGKEELEATANVDLLTKKTGVVSISSVKKTDTESPLKTCLWQAVSRSDRMDFAIQKSVELGVSSIQPVTTERSPWRLKTKQLDKKMQHWQGIIISACEQSGRTILPRVYTPRLLPDLLEQRPQSTDAILLDPIATTGINGFEFGGMAIDILCGPEGGLSQAEIEMAKNMGFTGFHIGPRIMRTETAATSILGILQTKYGDCG